MVTWFALAIYTLASYYIRFLFFLASFLHPRPRHFRKIRTQARKDFENLTNENLRKKNIYWFHGASVGELDQAKALARVLKTQEPNSFLILSWVSDSVTPKNLQDSPADFHLPLPLDGPFSYNTYMDKLPIRKLVVFAWDTWTWLILSARKRNTQIYLACATLGEKSGRRGWLSRNLTRLTFMKLDGILPAHEIHEKSIRELLDRNPDQVTSDETSFHSSHSHPPTSKHPDVEIAKPFIETLGDTRFDSVIEKMLRPKPKHLHKLMNPEDSQIILFASTYSICEEGILHWMEDLVTWKNTNRKVWIFPHKIESKRIQELKSNFKNLGYRVSLFSENHFDSDIVLFDELGILAFAYEYASIAYVGGALHNRVHNTIEPAYWSLPLITGHKISNASEAILMNRLGGLKTILSTSDMPQELESLLSQGKDSLKKMGEINHNFVMENQGASEKIYQRIWSD